MTLVDKKETDEKAYVYHSKLTHKCVARLLSSVLFFVLSLQPEEYGQEAMEGQGEAMLDPEGETYDESQQVIRVHQAKRLLLPARLRSDCK